jgi:glycosyltransferase involved in cell wall biosynthesis
VRIVHVADSFAPDVGGIERQVETLAARQHSAGHDVTVITAVAEPAEMDFDVARAASGRWLTVAFPWRNHRMVAAVLDNGPPIDVVHAHFTVISPMAIYVARAASRRGIPVAVTVHSLWWQVRVATRVATLPFGWGRIRAVWSGVSSVAARQVQLTLPRVGPASVVPNLVDTSWWREGEAACTGGAGPVRMILVGRLKKRKHIDEFIDVLAQVRKRVPADTKVQVDVVGEGPRRADLQAQLERQGLTDWVTLLGHRSSDDVRRLLHEADVFVAPSRQESFGIAALEARSAGLPVVGYRRTGLVDFITDGFDGLLVTDAAAMVDALVRLAGDRDELRRLRNAARNCPPPIVAEEALRAVDELYARAREELAPSRFRMSAASVRTRTPIGAEIGRRRRG